MKNVQKIASILMAASLTMGLFAGCSSKTASTSSDKVSSTPTATADANAKKGDGAKKNDPAEMKTIYTNVLKSLVSANTITQVQSDKVLEALTKDVQNVGGKPSGTPGTDGAKPNGTPPSNGTQPNGTPPANGAQPNGSQPADGAKPKSDRLSELVSSKVITQEQADTINQKIQEAMKSNQSTTNNSTNNTTNSTTSK